MVKSLAKKAMTTSGQKACFVLDHLIEALAGDPSSSIRRALILVDIDQNTDCTQSMIMDRLDINKSALNREIDWLFNYGCITVQTSASDARLKTLQSCGYAQNALRSALDYFDGDHEKLKAFLNLYIKVLRQDKPTLRDAKILAYIYEREAAPKSEILGSISQKPTTTDHRAFGEILNASIVKEVQNAA